MTVGCDTLADSAPLSLVFVAAMPGQKGGSG